MSEQAIPQGEQTKSQIRGRGDIAGLSVMFPSFSAPLPGTYETYRLMRANPTLAIARAAGAAPLRVARWAVEAKSGVKDEVVSFVRNQLTALWPRLIKDVVLSIEYGWQGFELVYGVDGPPE